MSIEDSGRVLWRMSFILKWVYPGFLAVMLVILIVAGFASGSPSPALVLGPVILLSLVGLAAGTIWSLVDEVRDHGDFLKFRKGRTEQVVQLVDILNINTDKVLLPVKVTVKCRSAGPLGASLSFGVAQYFPFQEPHIVAELIQRVDAAKLAATDSRMTNR